MFGIKGGNGSLWGLVHLVPSFRQNHNYDYFRDERKRLHGKPSPHQHPPRLLEDTVPPTRDNHTLRPRPQACSAGDGGNGDSGTGRHGFLLLRTTGCQGWSGPGTHPAGKGTGPGLQGWTLPKVRQAASIKVTTDRNSGPRCSEFQPTLPCVALQACPSTVSRGWNQLICPPGSPGSTGSGAGQALGRQRQWMGPQCGLLLSRGSWDRATWTRGPRAGGSQSRSPAPWWPGLCVPGA